MSMKLKQQKALISQLCRVCGEENKQCIPILGESGKKQNILRKMHSCLPVVVEETDMMPKQICLSCLPKLDSMWEMYQLCKEGQTKIENKMHTISKRYEEEPQSFHKPNLIEEKLKLLTENNPIRYGESAVIFLAPPSPPPPAAPNTMMILPEQVMIVEQPPVAYPPGPAKDTTLYQENLVNANSASLVPKQRVLAPKPLPPPPLKETETQPPPPRRRKEGDLPKAQRRKRTLQMCKYCNRSFPDDIIDHHVNLHLRQSFFTCIDCNKNFRSEEAMSRHRCSTNSEPINLDPE